MEELIEILQTKMRQRLWTIATLQADVAALERTVEILGEPDPDTAPGTPAGTDGHDMPPPAPAPPDPEEADEREPIPEELVAGLEPPPEADAPEGDAPEAGTPDSGTAPETAGDGTAVAPDTEPEDESPPGQVADLETLREALVALRQQEAGLEPDRGMPETVEGDDDQGDNDQGETRPDTPAEPPDEPDDGAAQVSADTEPDPGDPDAAGDDPVEAPPDPEAAGGDDDGDDPVEAPPEPEAADGDGDDPDDEAAAEPGDDDDGDDPVEAPPEPDDDAGDGDDPVEAPPDPDAPDGDGDDPDDEAAADEALPEPEAADGDDTGDDPVEAPPNPDAPDDDGDDPDEAAPDPDDEAGDGDDPTEAAADPDNAGDEADGDAAATDDPASETGDPEGPVADPELVRIFNGSPTRIAALRSIVALRGELDVAAVALALLHSQKVTAEATYTDTQRMVRQSLSTAAARDLRVTNQGNGIYRRVEAEAPAAASQPNRKDNCPHCGGDLFVDRSVDSRGQRHSVITCRQCGRQPDSANNNANRKDRRRTA